MGLMDAALKPNLRLSSVERDTGWCYKPARPNVLVHLNRFEEAMSSNMRIAIAGKATMQQAST
jgi:hypothetical protein